MEKKNSAIDDTEKQTPTWLHKQKSIYSKTFSTVRIILIYQIVVYDLILFNRAKTANDQLPFIIASAYIYSTLKKLITFFKKLYLNW